jgi:hypothetical protein
VTKDVRQAIKEEKMVTEVVTMYGVEQNGTLTRKSNYFEAHLLFLPQWKMYAAQVQAQNKHSPP